MWAYYNLFQPVGHLVENSHDGTRLRRRRDDAQTPFARLLATDPLDPTVRERLEQLYAATNPRALRRAILAGVQALLYPRPSTSPPPLRRLATPSQLARPVEATELWRCGQRRC
jgi:hypothetical protein